MTLRLIVFDVDGTLVDSQAQIVAAMTGAFERAGLSPPSRLEILSIVGLSLPVAMARLSPAGDVAVLVDGYRQATAEMRTRPEAASSLYPGTIEMLDRLARHDHLRLAIATGKSRRGLDHFLAWHGISERFVSLQTADDHPSKPHPSMLEAALRETGVEPASAVMIGDTTFDVEMARSAGLGAIGVRWGYHPADALLAAGTSAVIGHFDELDAALGLGA